MRCSELSGSVSEEPFVVERARSSVGPASDIPSTRDASRCTRLASATSCLKHQVFDISFGQKLEGSAPFIQIIHLRFIHSEFFLERQAPLTERKITLIGFSTAFNGLWNRSLDYFRLHFVNRYFLPRLHFKSSPDVSRRLPSTAGFPREVACCEPSSRLVTENSDALQIFLTSEGRENVSDKKEI